MLENVVESDIMLIIRKRGTQKCQRYLYSMELKLVLAWTIIHQDELMQNWELSKDGKTLNRINPLI